MNISNLDEAKKQFIEALKYETDKSSLASTYNYLFVLYRQQGDMQKAIENSQKAIQYAKYGGDFVRFPHVTQ